MTSICGIACLVVAVAAHCGGGAKMLQPKSFDDAGKSWSLQQVYVCQQDDCRRNAYQCLGVNK